MCQSLILKDIEKKTVIDQLKHLRNLDNADVFINTYKNLIPSENSTEEEQTVSNEKLNEVLNLSVANYRKIRDDKQIETFIKNYEFCKKYFPAGNTFRDVIINMQPSLGRTTEKFVTLPPNPIYAIILSFLSGFNAQECNELLASGGYQKLHGRNPIESIFIYGLNNKMEYKDCFFDYIIKIDLNFTNPPLVNSFEKLELLVNELKIEGDSNVNYTDGLTTEVENLKTKEDLEKYLENNKSDFRNVRTTPVRYLCKWILDYVQLPEVKENIRNCQYTGTLKQIFSDFRNFYLNYTHFSLNDFYSERFGTVGGCNNQDVNGITNNLLEQVLTGKKELKRKFFILLYIFFYHKKGLYKSTLNDMLGRCGFDEIDRDKKTIEDVFFIELIDEIKNENQDVFLEHYTECLFVSKVLFEFVDLKQRLKSTSPYHGIFLDLCDAFIGFYSNLTYVSVAEEEIVQMYAQVYTNLDATYRAINNNSNNLNEEKRNYIIEILDSILELRLQEYITQLPTSLNSISKFLEENKITINRKNNDLTVYIENPLYLNPRTDL